MSRKLHAPDPGRPTPGERPCLDAAGEHRCHQELGHEGDHYCFRCGLRWTDTGLVDDAAAGQKAEPFAADDPDDFIRLHSCGVVHRKSEDCPKP